MEERDRFFDEMTDAEYLEHVKDAIALYEQLLSQGVEREEAKDMVLTAEVTHQILRNPSAARAHARAHPPA